MARRSTSLRNRVYRVPGESSGKNKPGDNIVAVNTFLCVLICLVDRSPDVFTLSDCHYPVRVSPGTFLSKTTPSDEFDSIESSKQDRDTKAKHPRDPQVDRAVLQEEKKNVDIFHVLSYTSNLFSAWRVA